MNRIKRHRKGREAYTHMCVCVCQERDQQAIQGREEKVSSPDLLLLFIARGIARKFDVHSRLTRLGCVSVESATCVKHRQEKSMGEGALWRSWPDFKRWGRCGGGGVGGNVCVRREENN